MPTILFYNWIYLSYIVFWSSSSKALSHMYCLMNTMNSQEMEKNSDSYEQAELAFVSRVGQKNFVERGI